MGKKREQGSRECNLIVGDTIVFMPRDSGSKWDKLRANKATIEAIDEEDDDYDIYIESKNVRLGAERKELIFSEGKENGFPS